MSSIQAKSPSQAPPATHAESPLVSVIIPCYNQGRFLGEAIESVRRQSWPHREIVVVDDGSQDDTASVASRYPEVRLLRQPNRGVSAARNNGLAHSRGAFVVFLDADDRLLPDALETGVRCLQSHPTCAFVYGNFVRINEDGSPRASSSSQPAIRDGHYEALLRNNFIGLTGIVMFRREAVEAVGGFDVRPCIQGCADYDLYLRIARTRPICGHGHLVAEYRRYDHSLSRNYAAMLRAALCALDGQRKFVQSDRSLKRAYAEGTRFWRRYYGEKTVEQARHARARGEHGSAARDLLALARLAPRILLTALGEKIGRAVGWRRTALTVVPSDKKA